MFLFIKIIFLLLFLEFPVDESLSKKHIRGKYIWLIILNLDISIYLVRRDGKII